MPGPALRAVGPGRVQIGVGLVGPGLLRGVQHVLRVEPDRRVQQHQPLDPLRRGPGQVHGDRAAERVPEHDDPGQPELVEHGQRVGHVLLQVPRRSPRRVPVPAQVDGDEPELGQRLGQHPPARGVRGHPVQRQHRRPVGGAVRPQLQLCHTAIVPRHPRHPVRCQPAAAGVRTGVSGGRGCIRACPDPSAPPPRRAVPASGPAALAPGLVRRPRAPGPEPVWDAAARRVLAHDAGPLRVIGGPGTGKTTLLLAAVAARVAAGAEPERTLLLVGSRRAAGELRERLVERLHADGGPARTSREPLVRTVHSYAFGVLRLHAARNGDPPPRLLASAEQDAVVRDLLLGELLGEAPDSGWPARLRPAIGLPGFAAELRELLLRAAERGLGPDELTELGRRHDVPEWVAAGRFFRTYEHVILLRGAAGRGAPQATAPALDAAELVSAALDALAFDPELLAAERQRVRHLVVDDAQDLDPQQLELVRALGSTAGSVLLAGDPDQAVLTFRGADPDGLRALEAETVVLGTDHRSAAGRPGRRRPAGRPAARLRPGPGAGRPRRARGRRPPDGPADDGTVAVRIFGSPAQEAGWVADQLRRAHLGGGVPWSRMAVLVRSTRRSLPALRRALLAAGVPIAAPPDELPLARQPAVVPLLMVLRFAARPHELDADAATALLTSPLGLGRPDADAPAAPRAAAAARRAGRPERTAARPRSADSGSDRAAGGRAGQQRPAAGRGAAGGRPRPARPAGRAAAAGDRAAAPGRRAAGHGRRRHPRRGERRGGALAGLAGHRARARGGARPAPAAARSARPPTATSTPCSRCSTPRPSTPTGCPAPTSPASPSTWPTSSCPATRWPRGPRRARRCRCSPRTPPAAASGTWSPCPRCRRAAGPTCGCAAACWATSGWSTWSPAPRPRARRRCPGRRRCWPRNAGCSTWPAPGPGTRCWSARWPGRTSSPRGSSTSSTRCRPTRPTGRCTGRAGRWCWPSWSASCAGRCASRTSRRPGRRPRARAQRRRRAAAQLARLADAGVPGAHPDDWYGLAPLSTDAPLRAPGEVVPVSPVGRREDRPLPAALGAGAARRRRAGRAGRGHRVAGARAGAGQRGRRGRGRAGGGAALGLVAPRRRGALVRPPRARPGARHAGRVRRLGAVQPGRGAAAGRRRAAGAARPARRPSWSRPGRGCSCAAGSTGSRSTRRAGRWSSTSRPGKVALSSRAAAEHPQLAIYQLAAALGAFGRLLEPGAPPGGARLVYLADQKAGGQVKEPAQPPAGRGRAGPLGGGAAAVRPGVLGLAVRGPGRPGLRPLPGPDQLPDPRGRPAGARAVTRRPARRPASSSGRGPGPVEGHPWSSPRTRWPPRSACRRPPTSRPP